MVLCLHSSYVRQSGWLWFSIRMLLWLRGWLLKSLEAARVWLGSITAIYNQTEERDILLCEATETQSKVIVISLVNITDIAIMDEFWSDGINLTHFILCARNSNQWCNWQWKKILWWKTSHTLIRKCHTVFWKKKINVETCIYVFIEIRSSNSDV